ncbi:hypothetical protein C8R45DRAFT_1026150 [Mycena sanguinolenta]|nr:hypothetical protein C8R45DRAFT_1026150 [Mycena sanguinolenta]
MPLHCPHRAVWTLAVVRLVTAGPSFCHTHVIAPNTIVHLHATSTCQSPKQYRRLRDTYLRRRGPQVCFDKV